MSTYRHILLEVYCSGFWNGSDFQELPSFCKNGFGIPGYHCIESKCNFSTFTYADNELAFAGEYGEVPNDDFFIGMGDFQNEEHTDYQIPLRKKRWKEICKRKIKEASEEYLEVKEI